METKRLIIDAIRETDKADYFRNLSHDRKVLETFICKYTETPEELDISPYLTNEKMFAIRLKETGRLIGIILYFNDDGCSCEIGYGLGSAYWKKGYATEAVRRFLDYCFNEKGFRTVNASFFTGNDASRRVMEKCGMTFDRFSEKELKYLGLERDLTYYSISRDGAGKEPDESRDALQAGEAEENAGKTGKSGGKGMRIETDRLVITELTVYMAQDVHENSLDEDTRRFVPDEVFETKEEALETITFLISQYGKFSGPLVYAVLEREPSRNIGYVQMVPMEDGTWEIGYHITKAYTGRGFATEAVKAFLPVMAEAIGIREVYGICLAENAASCRVMEKCGFEDLYAGTGTYQGMEREIVKKIWRKKDT